MLMPETGNWQSKQSLETTGLETRSTVAKGPILKSSNPSASIAERVDSSTTPVIVVLLYSISSGSSCSGWKENVANKTMTNTNHSVTENAL